MCDEIPHNLLLAVRVERCEGMLIDGAGEQADTGLRWSKKHLGQEDYWREIIPYHLKNYTKKGLSI